MKIPAYQIQNVLQLYFRQLGEKKILERTDQLLKISDRSRAISSEGTRQAIIDKVAAGIVEKIISKAAETSPVESFSGRPAEGTSGDSDHLYRDKSRFTYLLIDRHDNQILRTAKDIQPRHNPAQPDD